MKTAQFYCRYGALLICAFLTLFLSNPLAGQYTLQDEDVVVENGIIQSCSYDFLIKDIIIPDTLDGQVVTGIADGKVTAKEYCEGVFFEKGIHKITFPSTLERIGDCAFSENHLDSIDLTGCPDLVSIGNYAFWYNYNLESVDLSACSALKEIGSYVFYDDNIIYASFSGCTALEQIGYMSFFGNGLTSLDLSDCSSLRVIGGQAFDYNSLVNVNFNGCEALEEIRTGAFSNCNLSTLDLSACSALTLIDYVAFRGNELTSIDLTECSALKTIGTSAFADNLIETVNLSVCPTLSEIGPHAFRSNKLTSIDFSANSSLLEIGEGAFHSNLLDGVDLTACDALEKIGKDAFAENQFDSFVLPVNSNYKHLSWEDVLGNSHAGGEEVFDLSANYYIPIPYTLIEEDVDFDSGTIKWCTYNFEYTDIIIPDTLHGLAVERIGRFEAGNGVFYKDRVTSVIFPSTLEIVGRYAFNSNSSLLSLDFSSCENLKAIESYAIVGNALTHVDFDNCSALSKIERYAFRDNALSSIDLSACTALATIGREAFESNNIVGFDLPVNDEFIELGWKDPLGNEYAGGETVNDHSLYYYVPAPYILTDADVEVTNGFIETCSYDFHLREIIVPDTLDGQAVTAIGGWGWGERMVFGHNRIVSITLPSSVESIGETAFYDNDLDNINLEACIHLKSIGTGAFILNPLSSFKLPIPEIPGYIFNYWIDGEGFTYSGGDTVRNLSTSYTAVLTAAYAVNFTVTDGVIPVLGAIISLAGYEASETDEVGMAVFDKVIPENEISYSVTHTDYETVSGLVSVVDSDVVEEITMLPLTAISESGAKKFRIYPNPAGDLVHILFNEDAELTVLDVTGRVVLTHEHKRGESSIPVGHLEPGSYFFRVESGRGVLGRKVMVQ
ncbi:MAG: leucine-rich repeat protein [Bacteroidetes bacterium]|nr:leucine-rich repeat protein [Bacteroidota bacterium]